jgi:hypothetical protein
MVPAVGRIRHKPLERSSNPPAKSPQGGPNTYEARRRVGHNDRGRRYISACRGSIGALDHGTITITGSLTVIDSGAALGTIFSSCRDPPQFPQLCNADGLTRRCRVTFGRWGHKRIGIVASTKSPADWTADGSILSGNGPTNTS